MDSRLRGNDVQKRTERMTQQHANFDTDQRRAGIRRTVWIVGALAVAILVLFVVKQVLWP